MRIASSLLFNLVISTQNSVLSVSIFLLFVDCSHFTILLLYDFRVGVAGEMVYDIVVSVVSRGSCYGLRWVSIVIQPWVFQPSMQSFLMWGSRFGLLMVWHGSVLVIVYFCVRNCISIKTLDFTQFLRICITSERRIWDWLCSGDRFGEFCYSSFIVFLIIVGVIYQNLLS